MSKTKKIDVLEFAIGILIAGFILLKIIGFILQDKEAPYSSESLLEAVMQESGGKQNWDALENLSYTKAFKLFKEDGTVEIDRKEVHQYTFKKSVNRVVSWEEKDNTYTLYQKNDTLYQTKNTLSDTTAIQSQLQAKLNAATFVVGLPFTLDDASAALDYEGLVAFQGVPCHSLKVSFNGSQDVWRLYYQEDTLSWLGYWVHTSDHYSLVLNEKMEEVSGFMFSRKRKSFRTDSLQNITYLRATYEYDDFKIN